jgi:16S rRNA (cytosine1402-N4)-methyltransferase
METSDLHIPVMLQEVVDTLAPQDGQHFVDATFGNGGYSEALLGRARCTVSAFDRDPDAIQRGVPIAGKYDGRLRLIQSAFAELGAIFNQDNQVDGIVFDLGVCSVQLDQPERGFSFRFDGPLDMRMEKTGRDASDIVNSYSEKQIADILWQFGEEKASRRIAKAIVSARAEAPILRTSQLMQIIHSVMPRPKPGQADSATRSFQALRIYVNQELEQLEQALQASELALKPGGVLVVVSFHSLEDRIVKQFIRQRSGRAPNPNKYLPQAEHQPAALFSISSAKPKLPSEKEIAANPRARSAKLRAAWRTDAPAQPIAQAG